LTAGSQQSRGNARRAGRAPLGALTGLVFLFVVVGACLGTLPWTLGSAGGESAGQHLPRYNDGRVLAARLPPWWVTPNADQARRLEQLGAIDSEEAGVVGDGAGTKTGAPASPARFWLGSDNLGRSLLVRCLAGGGISLVVGILAAAISVAVGTLYGAVSGYVGGRVDAVMMRTVDVLYGLPYILLVVLLAVATDALIGEYVSREGQRAAWVAQRAVAGADVAALEAEALQMYPPRTLSARARGAIDVGALLLAISGVSWLSTSRVIRAQVLSLRRRAFVEAATSAGATGPGIFVRHILPNLWGTVMVYATLTVPQAILQESFLSFLGIGVKPPLPSWGNLAAEGLSELNPYQSNWWLLAFPSLLLAGTLMALTFVGEAVRSRILDKAVAR
jgi:oligopeptide transport system permease protein